MYIERETYINIIIIIIISVIIIIISSMITPALRRGGAHRCNDRRNIFRREFYTH